MAYRRRQGSAGRPSATFEDFRSTSAVPPPSAGDDYSLPALVTNQSSSSSLAAQAIRASAAHRDSSLSSAYGDSAFAAARDSSRQRSTPSPGDPASYEYTSMKSLNESKYSGFWGVLARKAKTILDDDNAANPDSPGRTQHQAFNTVTGGQFHHSYGTPDSNRKTETPPFHKSSEAIASSLNFIGGTIKNALEEGLTIVEHKTADIIHETRKLNIRRKGSDPNNAQSQPAEKFSLHHFPQIQTDYETQLKASRDVANAMAAKAKLLLRELKTVKADLAFAKERCAQLEEENKLLRESREKGDDPEDDDLIRLQLETLLAEKARLAQENSVYARENRFLREIVEYHQLTMQDVVYVDEGIEEVSEVTPIRIPTGTSSVAVSEAQSPRPAAPPTPKTSTSAATQQPDEALHSMVLPESFAVAPAAPEHPLQAAAPNARASPPPVLAGEDAR